MTGGGGWALGQRDGTSSGKVDVAIEASEGSRRPSSFLPPYFLSRRVVPHSTPESGTDRPLPFSLARRSRSSSGCCCPVNPAHGSTLRRHSIASRGCAVSGQAEELMAFLPETDADHRSSQGSLPFCSLNQACFADAAVIMVGDGVRVEKPIQVLSGARTVGGGCTYLGGGWIITG